MLKLKIEDINFHKKQIVIENLEKIIVYRLCELQEDIMQDCEVEEHIDEIYKLTKTMSILQNLKNETK